MPGKAFYDGNVTLNRLPGYIQGSEFVAQNGATLVGAYAGSTNVVMKAAGASRVKTVVTGLLISAYAGATALPGIFIFLLDGIVLGGGNANVRHFYQKGLPINTGDNYWANSTSDDPLFIGSLATAVSVFSSSAGVAGCAIELIVKGYQIAA